MGLKVALGLALLLGYLDSPLGAGLALDEESYFAWAQRILAGDFGGPWFQDLLYPHVLAGVLWVGQGSVVVARLFNVGLGVFALFLLERVVRHLFSPRHAIAAVAAWILFGAVAIDELTLAKEPLMNVLLLAAMALSLKPARALPAGLLAGALVLMRGNFLFLLPFAGLAAAFGWPRRMAAVFVAGLLTLPGLFAIRNGVQEGRWLPTTASSGMVFFIGHNPNADGTWSAAPFARGTPLHEMPDYVAEASRRAGVQVDAKQASREFFGEGLRFIAENPNSELRLLWRKLRLALSLEEVPGNYSRACVRDRFLPALWLLPLVGAVLWPLALAAAIAHWRRRAVQLIAGGFIIYVGTLCLTFVVERYRLPLWIGAAVLAPEGARVLVGWLGATGRLKVVLAAVPVLAVLLWPVRSSDGSPETGKCLSLAGATLMQAGRFVEAEPYLAEAAQLAPSDSQVAFNLGVVFQQQQRWADALGSYSRAVDLAPADAQARWAQGSAALMVDDGALAANAFDRFFTLATPEQLRQACEEIAADSALHRLAARCR